MNAQKHEYIIAGKNLVTKIVETKRKILTLKEAKLYRSMGFKVTQVDD